MLAKPQPIHLLTGFVTDFFDTLGIGSFATTTSIFKFRNMVKDELIPGTLNVGHTLPTILEAIIYITTIEVQITTLVLMIGSAVVGAWFGAGLVVRLSRRAVRRWSGYSLILSRNSFSALRKCFSRRVSATVRSGLATYQPSAVIWCRAR